MPDLIYINNSTTHQITNISTIINPENISKISTTSSLFLLLPNIGIDIIVTSEMSIIKKTYITPNS